MDAKKILKNWFYHESYRIPAEHVDKKVGTPADIEDKVQALFICVAADGTVSEAEKNWIYGSALARGISVELLEKMPGKASANSKEIIARIKNSPRSLEESKRLIYNAIRACAADGEISQKERNKIGEFAQEFGLSDKFVKELFSLFTEEQNLKHKLSKLLSA